MIIGIILFILFCYLIGHLLGTSKKQLLKDSQRKYEKLETELEQLKIEVIKNQLKEEDKIEIYCGGR